jgi:hypothetical protein
MRRRISCPHCGSGFTYAVKSRSKTYIVIDPVTNEKMEEVLMAFHCRHCGEDFDNNTRKQAADDAPNISNLSPEERKALITDLFKQKGILK